MPIPNPLLAEGPRILHSSQNPVEGKTQRALRVTNATAKLHTHAVYQKLGVHSRSELVELVQGRQ